MFLSQKHFLILIAVVEIAFAVIMVIHTIADGGH